MKSRVLLFLEHTENRRLLSEWLGMHYQVLLSDSTVQSGQAVPLLDEPFDLCILDGLALDYLWEWVQARKKAEQPVFLPFLLITPYPDVKMITRHLWQSVDELITKPIEKLELQARVEILLRSRQFSLQLKSANEQLHHEIIERQRVEAEREKALCELRDSEARFRHLVEFNIIGIMLADTNGKIVEANEALLNMVGYTREDLLLGLHWDEITPPEYRHLDEQAIEQLRTSRVCQPLEKEYICKDGSRIHVLLGAMLVDGSESNCVCFVLNISDRVSAEAEIRKALEQEKELNELKSRFVSMVSHEFRNPLNAISASAQILERFGDKWDKEKQSDFFRRIKGSVDRMTQLLDDVLLLGRAGVGKLQFNPASVDLENLCRHLVEEIKLSTGNKHAIAFGIQGQCTTVDMDENLLRYILSNLLSNAIKYSPAGGTVQFELFCQDAAVIFQIQDEGIGIPAEDVGQLFTSFHRAKNVGSIPGTGLGLAIVKQCVDLHGGAIAVASEVGVGTTFTVTLPFQNCRQDVTMALNQKFQ
jgi:PAS domain S-box-containing protein